MLAVAFIGIVGCAHPAKPAEGAPGQGQAPGDATPPGPPPMALAAKNASLSWMLGAWECSAAYQPETTAPDAHAHGRLIVDAYMDVWMGAGFEADAPGVPKGDMYFGFDEASRTWSLMGFRSDGSHYTLSSPGDVGGRMEWTGTVTREGKATDMRAVFAHRRPGQLDIRMERLGGSPWTTFDLVCSKPGR
jgi:hypothetical protein